MEESKVSKSKDYIDLTSVKRIYEYVFHKNSERIVISILSGGVKSAVYLIEDGNFKVVLKIAHSNNDNSLSIDKNTFWWEAKMLELLEKLDIPTPKLLYYDESCVVCHAPYIFMTYLEGKNYNDYKNIFTESQKEIIEYQIGCISKKISTRKAEKYFIPSNSNKIFNDNFEFISYLFELLFQDARRCNLDISDMEFKIKQILVERKNSINNVLNICLSHVDLWDGNILVKDGRIRGIVDFADLYYCDELMTFYFHTIDGITSKNFLRGYDNKELTFDEKVRIEIYRLYVILKMIVECKMKDYGKFDWMYENIHNQIRKLTS